MTDGERTQCLYWNESASVYLGNGLAALPNPAPPGHALSWRANATAGSPAALAAAWNISGPLVRRSRRLS